MREDKYFKKLLFYIMSILSFHSNSSQAKNKLAQTKSLSEI